MFFIWAIDAANAPAAIATSVGKIPNTYAPNPSFNVCTLIVPSALFSVEVGMKEVVLAN